MIVFCVSVRRCFAVGSEMSISRSPRRNLAVCFFVLIPEKVVFGVLRVGVCVVMVRGCCARR